MILWNYFWYIIPNFKVQLLNIPSNIGLNMFVRSPRKLDCNHIDKNTLDFPFYFIQLGFFLWIKKSYFTISTILYIKLLCFHNERNIHFNMISHLLHIHNLGLLGIHTIIRLSFVFSLPIYTVLHITNRFHCILKNIGYYMFFHQFHILVGKLNYSGNLRHIFLEIFESNFHNPSNIYSDRFCYSLHKHSLYFENNYITPNKYLYS